MSLTVLIDLDDTLLVNNMDIFIPPYLQSLAASIANIPPKLIIQGILSATQVMQSNVDPSKTLEQVFDQYFYDEIGYCKEQLSEELFNFYQNEFYKLRVLTSPKPGAVQTVEQLINDGHRIVIATNPLFPRTASMQRVEWAGLSHLLDKILLVTTFETFHYSKPSSAYIAEILAQLGWEDNPAVMVGNSLDDDIIPADSFGLPTYYISDNHNHNTSHLHSSHSAGDISGVMPWVQKLEKNDSKINEDNFSTCLAVLHSTPAAIHTFLLRDTPYLIDDKSLIMIDDLLVILIKETVNCFRELSELKSTQNVLHGEFEILFDNKGYVTFPNKDRLSNFEQFVEIRNLLIKQLLRVKSEFHQYQHFFSALCKSDKNVIRAMRHRLFDAVKQ